MSDPKTVDLDKLDKLIEAYDAAREARKNFSGSLQSAEGERIAFDFWRASEDLNYWLEHNRHAIASELRAARIKEADDVE